jgi:hypothetical protein
MAATRRNKARRTARRTGGNHVTEAAVKAAISKKNMTFRAIHTKLTSNGGVFKAGSYTVRLSNEPGRKNLEAFKTTDQKHKIHIFL